MKLENNCLYEQEIRLKRRLDKPGFSVESKISVRFCYFAIDTNQDTG